MKSDSVIEWGSLTLGPHGRRLLTGVVSGGLGRVRTASSELSIGYCS